MIDQFGVTADGTGVERFVLTNANGIELHAITYGGIITRLLVPDRHGTRGDVVLGHDTLARYADALYFGAIVGRHANRIAYGRFSLDGRTYQLATNNPPHHLHGGWRGFDKQVWRGEPRHGAAGRGVTFSRTSPDGEEHYPGMLRVSVSYLLNDANELTIDYDAATDTPTIVNLTQHTYFNLSAGASPTVLDHVLRLAARHYTPVDAGLIPTGEIAPVAGTPFDFTTAARIGARIAADHHQLLYAGGYDHNWVLDHDRVGLAYAATLVDPASDRYVEVHTTEPGIQFYSGNFLDGSITGKDNRVYEHRSGCCLETQHFPDAPSHPNFPSTVLRPGQQYRSRTVWKFGW